MITINKFAEVPTRDETTQGDNADWYTYIAGRPGKFESTKAYRLSPVCWAIRSTPEWLILFLKMKSHTEGAYTAVGLTTPACSSLAIEVPQNAAS